MRFQAAFGRGTRGQRVHILPVGVFRATWERFLGFQAAFLFIATLFFLGWGVCLCGFRLPSGAGRVGSKCPTYLSGMFCAA